MTRHFTLGSPLSPAGAMPHSRVGERRIAPQGQVADAALANGSATPRDWRERLASHRWQDGVWMRQRRREDPLLYPLSIYRLDPRAWRHDSLGKPLGWEPLATQLVPYAADLGFTHVEVKHVAQADAGAAFAGFVNDCHVGGLGVIVEWPLACLQAGLSEAEALELACDWLAFLHVDGLRLKPVVPDSDAAALSRLMDGLAARSPDTLLFVDDHDAEAAPTTARALALNTHWSRATQAYLSQPHEARGQHHHRLVEGLACAFESHFVLPLIDEQSDDGEATWLERMAGDTWQRFANLRAGLGFMWAHPGKKLVGMGTEFAHGQAWRPAGELDWSLLDDPCHGGMLRLVADLNRLYGNEPALHHFDCQPEGFAWVVGDDSVNSVIAFLRYGPEGTAPLLAIANFTPRVLRGYRLGVPALGSWYEVLNSDSTFYGGSNVGNAHGVRAQLLPSHGHPASLELTLPPLATLLLRQGDWPA
ncbi:MULTISPECIES: alpha amylase C-terminal domain-containing protein [Halomonadaceae]|uniref:alpha amylase C-terminal domain-containing protein n=1 Tax=Halomonadaceae TaxID=28256 RepID=UPI0004DB8684|nr:MULTISPECIES: alpha amylase C-terminal domain-containing protein [Halomonas]MCD6007767.1 alpha amylase C-terminal domain-containing protein [Halomonas sp. IOP_31]